MRLLLIPDDLAVLGEETHGKAPPSRASLCDLSPAVLGLTSFYHGACLLHDMNLPMINDADHGTMSAYPSNDDDDFHDVKSSCRHDACDCRVSRARGDMELE